MFSTATEMSPIFRDQLRIMKNAQRNLWKSHRSQISIAKTTSARILLADLVSQFHGICEEVWPLSEECQRTKAAGIRACSAKRILAICIVENGYSRSFFDGIRIAEVSPDRDRLFHQVGRSCFICKGDKTSSGQIHQEQSHLQIWCSQQNHYWQWL